jgi:phosphatidylglycerol---prolipoprotein diacylglyceryl transferase
MHPILFRLGDFPIGTYGLMLTLGFIGGMYLARHLGRRDGLEPDALSDISMAVLLGGILGSKLLMIVVDLVHGESLASVFSLATLRAGGAIHGGVILGLLTFFWRMRKLNLPLSPTMDALTPGLALGQALGRWGCFFAGCCFGTECQAPWAVTFTSPDISQGTPLDMPLHPVQLYNSLANFTVLGLLLLIGRKRRFKGQVAASYFLLEGLGRTITESWRGDLDRGVWFGISWLSTGRLTGFLFVLIGVSLWVWFRRQQQASPAGV